MSSASDTTMSAWLAIAAFIGMLLAMGAVVYADLTWRRIPNRLCLGIAVLAPIFTVASHGWTGLSDFAVRLGVALLVAAVLGVLFAMRQIGGGDVKLAFATLLWIPAADVPVMLMATVAAGAAIAIGLKVAERLLCGLKVQTVPYGLAIVVGAIFALSPMLMPLAANACAAIV